MKKVYQLAFPFFLFMLLLSCGSKDRNPSSKYKLTNAEKVLCDTLKIDPTIIQDIRNFNTSKIEPFHYSLSKAYEEGVETELNPIHLKGLVFDEQNTKSHDLVFKLKR